MFKCPLENKNYGGLSENKRANRSSPHQIKEVNHISPFPPLSSKMMDFLTWTAGYTLAPLGSVLKMMMSVPEALKNPQNCDPSPQEIVQFHPCTLNEAQVTAGKQCRTAVQSKSFKTFVLEGVTGSGKTEVYFEGIKEAYDLGLQSLVLVPEISLSTQWVERFEKRFGIRSNPLAFGINA